MPAQGKVAVLYHMVPTSPCNHTSSQPNIPGLHHQQKRLPKERRASLPHCLPNCPVLQASSELKPSIFVASWLQVQELGGWELSPKRALFALPDLLVTTGGSRRVLLLSLLSFTVSRFRLPTASRRLEVVPLCLGCFRTEVAFYMLL